MLRPQLAGMRTTDARPAVAVVAAGSAIKLVRLRATIEPIIAWPTVATILTRAHVANVAAGSAPAAIASLAMNTQIVPGPTDAVGVLISRHADVTARSADAAIPPGALTEAKVALTVADELI